MAGTSQLLDIHQRDFSPEILADGPARAACSRVISWKRGAHLIGTLNPHWQTRPATASRRVRAGDLAGHDTWGSADLAPRAAR